MVAAVPRGKFSQRRQRCNAALSEHRFSHTDQTQAQTHIYTDREQQKRSGLPTQKMTVILAVNLAPHIIEVLGSATCMNPPACALRWRSAAPPPSHKTLHTPAALFDERRTGDRNCLVMLPRGSDLFWSSLDRLWPPLYRVCSPLDLFWSSHHLCLVFF